MSTLCKFYAFLRAVQGNWRNAIFISCNYETCSHGQETPCSGFLFAADECGRVMLLPVESIHRLTGEEIDPAECSAVLPCCSFESAFSKCIEWNVPDPSECTLRQLCSEQNYSDDA